MSRYTDKRKESFSTKLNIFLFSKCILGELDDIGVDNFIHYEIKDEDINCYAAVYCQLLLTDKIKSLSVAEIEQKISTCKQENINIIGRMEEAYEGCFPTILSYDKFDDIVRGDECYYCGITLKDINDLIDRRKIFKKSGRGFNMEIDRKFPNKEYSNDNVVTCCYWCNNAKTDEFNEDEFNPIADGIRRVWVSRGIERLRKSVE